MVDQIRFTKNYKDTSTDTGFQFEFFCERCGNGYKSKFQPSATGTVSKMMDTASGLFGGIFSKASDFGQNVRSATWEKDHEKALVNAVNEISPHFIQCPKCSNWVCRDLCWNNQKGLCKNCSPDLGVEMAIAQSQKSVEEIHAHAAMAEEDKKLGKEYWREGIKATCPNCEKPLARNEKFCPECGFALKQKGKCSKCDANLQTGAKFCAECGEKA
jgi:hypothetical protein